jgi:predicted anti-sigma-YlaC factor YlaD
MRCEEARPLLVRGADAAAEDHLQRCDGCFAWLEEHDPIAGLVRAARPGAVTPPATLKAAIVQRWHPRRIPIPLGIAAAVALAALMAAATIAGFLLQPAATLAFLGTLANFFEPLASTLLTILAIPRALLFENPAVLTLYIAITVAVCAGWVRLYQRTIPRRIHT